MKLTSIRKLIKKTKQIDPKKLGRISFVYVDISSVDKDTKSITSPQIIAVGNAPSRARKEIKANDVLVATVRPNLNGVAIVPAIYHNEIASTGFCVLRSDETLLEPRYLYYFTQTDHFVSHLTKLSIGAGYPAVSDNDILDTEIPVPPPPEQQRIAGILEKADRVRRLRRYSLEMGDTYLQSVFLEMFGDPVGNPQGWKLDLLGKYTTLISSGSTPLGGSNVYKSQGIRFIRSQNVLMNQFDFSDLAYIDDQIHQRMKRTHVMPSDVLLNITGASIGRVSCYCEQVSANVNQHVCIIRCKPKEIDPTFLSYLISTKSFQENILITQSGATRQALNFDQIRRFKIIFPSLKLQRQFTRVVQQHEHLRTQQREAERQAEHLFQTLLYRAFRGEL